jgi:hypothetical protein
VLLIGQLGLDLLGAAVGELTGLLPGLLRELLALLFGLLGGLSTLATTLGAKLLTSGNAFHYSLSFRSPINTYEDLPYTSRESPES